MTSCCCASSAANWSPVSVTGGRSTSRQTSTIANNWSATLARKPRPANDVAAGHAAAPRKMTTDASTFNVFIGLGSNLGDSAVTLQRAARALAELPGTQLIDVSPLFRTRPVGPQDQPDYLNAAAHLVTTIAPVELLVALKGIEQQLGRTPTRHWGERVIDLDILDYENVILDSERLTLPHAHIGERGFV